MNKYASKCFRLQIQNLKYFKIYSGMKLEMEQVKVNFCNLNMRIQLSSQNTVRGATMKLRYTIDIYI